MCVDSMPDSLSGLKIWRVQAGCVIALKAAECACKFAKLRG
jgi:hypothetical protein